MNREKGKAMSEGSMSDDWPTWLSRRETSEYLKTEHGIRLGISALTAMAARGNGPPFAKEGRLTSYPRAEVDTWAQQRRSPLVRSTRELRRIRASATDLHAT
jgi:hypothetical protein